MTEAQEIIDKLREVLAMQEEAGDCNWIVIPEKIMRLMEKGETWYPVEVSPGVYEWKWFGGTGEGA